MNVPEELFQQFAKAIYALMLYRYSACGGKVVLSLLEERISPSHSTVGKSYNESGNYVTKKDGKSVTVSHDFNLYNNRGDDPGDVLIDRTYSFTHVMTDDGHERFTISASKRKRFAFDGGSQYGEIAVEFDGKKVKSVCIEEHDDYYVLKPTVDPAKQKLDKIIEQSMPLIDSELTKCDFLSAGIDKTNK